MKLIIACAQINTVVGDLAGNAKKIYGYVRKAEKLGVDIVSFPELSITGYPPEDLLLKPKFVKDNIVQLNKLAKKIKKITAIIGFVDKKENCLYNAAAIVYDGKIKSIYHKMLLPNYGVFDEKRYFCPGNKPLVFKFKNNVIGVNICEDIWHKDGPTKQQAKTGARLIINISASPYYMGKIIEREQIVRQQAKNNQVFVAYTNLVGGQDELVFDGQSMIVDSDGNIVARAKAFTEDLLIGDVEIQTSRIKSDKKPGLPLRKTDPLSPLAEVYQALVLGLKDYVTKNGFEKVVLGLSGGIDSAFVATVAADALGKNNVTSVFMPTRYSSKESETDAKQLAKNLGIRYINIPIEKVYKIYLAALEPQFGGLVQDITEENLQARIRGNILMALSNKFNWLVLTTGNKSEMSTGYATLYGDMAGGFAVIKDVPKTLVYQLAQYRNSVNPVIPENVLVKAPTAELRHNQKDSDTLPVYDKLDPILKAYIEEDQELTKIVRLGFDKKTVARVLNMVDKSEYKRRQSPPGIKITARAFGKDRRIPITNRYKTK